jgi:NitT/TauT family transport system permease protein
VSDAHRDAGLDETHDTDLMAAFEGELPAAPQEESFLTRSWRQYSPAVVVFFVVLVVWEGMTRLLNVQDFILPKPSLIFERLIDDFDVIVPAARRTLLEAVVGFAFGSAAGMLVALATVRWATMREGLLPFAIAANSVPIIALAPISNAMFGLTSLTSKAVVVGIVVFFPVMINAARGLTEVDPAELELMRSYASHPRDVLRRVRIPNALPYIFSALKVGTALSLIAAIVAEYFGGPRDVLGQYILNRASLFAFPDAWAGIAVASAMGIAFYGLVILVERRVMPWHAAFRPDSA